TYLLLLSLALLAGPLARAQQASGIPVGEATERQLSVDDPLKLWARDPHALDTESGDTLQQHEVHGQQAKIVKLKNVVPPIHFESGAADIPASTIEKLRSVLDGMRDLQNVRLHL